MGVRANRIAQSVFAVLFCATLVAYAAACLWTRGAAMYAALSAIGRPASLKEARAAVSTLENILCENLYQRTFLSEMHARAQGLLGKHATEGFAILRDRDGFLEYGGLAPRPPETARAYAQKLWRLQERAARNGGKLLFISPPARHRRYDADAYAADLPYPDPHALCDGVFFHLQRYGVAGLDLRATFENESLPFEVYTFRTDDRLPAEAAFAAFRAAVDALNLDFGAALDRSGLHRDIRNYGVTTYARSFLGALGRRAGAAFGGLDDFTVLWPALPSLYTLSIQRKDGAEQTWFGAARTTLLWPSVLTEAAETRDPYRTDLYRVYMGGAHPYARIRNLAAPAAPRLLLVHDGSAAPLAVLLAPLFREIQIVDPTAAGPDFDARAFLRARLNKSPPDYVIVESRAENLDRVLP
jgi:hypothetical protein